MVAHSHDGQRPPFVNWHAMTAMLLAGRQSSDLSSADYRLLMELAARTDPTTGLARASVRELAEAVHQHHHQATMRRLRDLERRGHLERLGTGRRGPASEHNTETYRLRGAATAPLDPAMRGRHGTSRGAATAPGRGAATAPVGDRERTDRAASPAPSRGSGSAAHGWRDPGPPTGMTRLSKAELAAALAAIKAKATEESGP
jgi:hypothetical protein